MYFRVFLFWLISGLQYIYMHNEEGETEFNIKVFKHTDPKAAFQQLKSLPFTDGLSLT